MKRHSPVRIPLVSTLLGAGTRVCAQGQASSFPPPAQQPEGQQVRQVWSTDQINNLVAPIALYPDPLLGQVLVASS